MKHVYIRSKLLRNVNIKCIRQSQTIAMCSLLCNMILFPVIRF